jgi:hypothetical protein
VTQPLGEFDGQGIAGSMTASANHTPNRSSAVPERATGIFCAINPCACREKGDLIQKADKLIYAV